MYQSQKLRVLGYLEDNGTINTYECYTKLYIVDLQKAIQLLRKEGYIISDKWVKKTNPFGKKIKYKEYRLEN